MFYKYESCYHFDMFVNPSFKITITFVNIARTTANTSNFIYWERFKIIRNGIFI